MTELMVQVDAHLPYVRQVAKVLDEPVVVQDTVPLSPGYYYSRDGSTDGLVTWDGEGGFGFSPSKQRRSNKSHDEDLTLSSP